MAKDFSNLMANQQHISKKLKELAEKLKIKLTRHRIRSLLKIIKKYNHRKSIFNKETKLIISLISHQIKCKPDDEGITKLFEGKKKWL